jgi:hypothetical protein
MEWTMQKRRRFKQTTTLVERLVEQARNLRAQARSLPPGPQRESLLRKARQDEAASHMSEWLNSPGLQPPRA